ELSVHLQSDTVTDPFGQRFKRGLLGVAPTTTVLERLPVHKAVPEACHYTLLIVRSMVDGLGQIITGRRGTEDVGGPIKIAQLAGALFMVGTILGGSAAPAFAQAAPVQQPSPATPAPAPAAPSQQGATVAAPAPQVAHSIRSIRVRGNQRLEPETIRAYANLS